MTETFCATLDQGGGGCVGAGKGGHGEEEGGLEGGGRGKKEKERVWLSWISLLRQAPCVVESTWNRI